MKMSYVIFFLILFFISCNQTSSTKDHSLITSKEQSCTLDIEALELCYDDGNNTSLNNQSYKALIDWLQKVEQYLESTSISQKELEERFIFEIKSPITDSITGDVAKSRSEIIVDMIGSYLGRKHPLIPIYKTSESIYISRTDTPCLSIKGNFLEY